MAAAKNPAPSDAVKQIQFLAAALKAPRITEAAARLADQAGDAGWTHEDYLAAVLERNASGAAQRIRCAGFPVRKTLDDFDCDRQPAVRQPVAALASGAFLTEARNVVLLGPPRHPQDPPRNRARRDRRPPRPPGPVCHRRRLGGGLIIIDEVGYLQQDAAKLVFQLVSSRYEHASLTLSSNLPFSAWGGVIGDQAVAVAMIDRIVRHADVLTLKGASYRLRDRGVDTLPSIRTTTSDIDN